MTAVSLKTLERMKGARIKEDFHEAGIYGYNHASPSELIRMFGYEEGSEFLTKVAIQYDSFTYDGTCRFCQLVPDYTTFTSSGNTSDSVFLWTICRINGEIPPCSVWSAPDNVRIDKVKFKNNSIVVYCYRNTEGIEEGNRALSEVEIQWPRRQEPDILNPSGTVPLGP